MESTYAKIIKEICKENDIELSSFSGDWVFLLKKDKKIKYILSHQFDLNTAAVQGICKDKCAAADILKHHNIACVEHVFFTTPTSGYLPKSGNTKQLLELLNKHTKLVCKPNEGTSGKNVFVVTNGGELEAAMSAVFESADSMAASPYYEIEKEYRIIVLDGVVKLVFSKEIPYLTGDGSSSLAQLILNNSPQSLPVGASAMDLGQVLDDGEIWKYGWKHNLAHGAVAHVVNDKALIGSLSDLAIAASNALNIRFASIDIIRTKDGFRVLEINSGVMMEHFASSSDENYAKAKEIYKEAIGLMFA